jgi:DNA repair exonuclease SbcCD nuclease subunit
VKILFLGDPHCQANNLEESEKLMHFFNDQILELKPDRIIILGDLFHNMAIIRSEVLDFWNSWLDILSETAELVVLVGNHDQISHQYQAIHALSVFNRIKKHSFKLADTPQVDGIYAYMPYIHDSDKFVGIANNLATQGAKVLISHQTFAGSQYENGFYAPDGINPDLLNYDLIISGHVHARQRFGKVIYPGTARWLTASDANQPKGLWLVDFDSNGKIQNESFIDTSHVCTPIVSLIWQEGEDMPTMPENAKVSIELIGSSGWVSKNKKLLKGQVSVKTKITDKLHQAKRDTGGSFENFIKNVYTTTFDRGELLEAMKEMGIV